MEWLASLFAVIGGIYAGIRVVSHWYKTRQTPLPMGKEDRESEISVFLERFFLVFQSHGINRTQIPRFLSEKYELSLHDMSTDENFLKALDEGIIETVCSRFGVQREWLDGKDVPVYLTNFFDKNPNGFINFLSNLKSKYRHIKGFALKSPKDDLEKKNYQSEIALIFRAEIANGGEFRETGIYKYFPLSEIYYWGYERTRLQLKAYVFIAWQFEIKIFGCELPENTIADIREGLIFPDLLIEKSHFVSWHPDEYIFSEHESRAVKDSKEALEARKYLSHMGWMEKLISLTGEIRTPLKN